MGYTVIKTGIFAKFNGSALLIVEAVFIGLVFVSIFVSALGKISDSEICSRDYVFAVLALDSLVLFIMGRFIKANTSVYIVSAIVLMLSIVYIVLRIIYREIKNEK